MSEGEATRNDLRFRLRLASSEAALGMGRIIAFVRGVRKITAREAKLAFGHAYFSRPGAPKLSTTADASVWIGKGFCKNRVPRKDRIGAAAPSSV